MNEKHWGALPLGLTSFSADSVRGLVKLSRDKNIENGRVGRTGLFI